MTNKNHNGPKLAGAAAVACSDLLDGFIRESCDNSARPTLGQINDLGDELREMANYRGVMAVIRDAAKKKNVRFDESDFPDGEIESLNNDVVIFRGSACEFLNRLFQSSERSVTRQPMGNGSGTEIPHSGDSSHLLGNVGRDVQVHSVAMPSNY
jgi:hypothetical protein